MIPYLGLGVTVFGACVLLALPLVPTFVEIRRKSDAVPLNVVQQHAGEIRHFADGFRNFMETIEPVLERCRESGNSAAGAMRDGTRYLVLGQSSEEALLPVKERGNCQVLIAAAGDLHLPSGIAFTKDIFAKGSISGKAGNQYRGILGEQNIHLAAHSTVLRWVHANGEFRAEIGCQLYGRVSSDRSIQLARECAFLRLNAPRVELGRSVNAGLPVAPEPGPGFREIIPARRLHEGDLTLRDGRVFRGDLIVRGRLRIGQGARIRGSVKSEKDLIVGNDVAVSGSLITERKMHIGRNCSIHGPIIAEREITIERGTQCGAAEFPTTVCAPRIIAEEGVVVFGTLWVRELGRVVTK